MKKQLLISYIAMIIVAITLFAQSVSANACWSTYAADSAARTFPYFPDNVNVVRDKEFSGGTTIANAIENGKFASTIGNWSSVADGTAKTEYVWWSSAFGGSLFINQSKNLTSGQDPARFQALEVFQDHRIIALPGYQYTQWAYIYINQSPVNNGGGSRHGYDRRDQAGNIQGCEATQVTVLNQFNLSNISAVMNNGTKTILPWLDSCCQEANTHSNATYFVNVSSITRAYMAVINSTNTTANGSIARNNTLWVNLTWDSGVIEPTSAFITLRESATGTTRNISILNKSTAPIDTTYGNWQAQRGGTFGPMSIQVSGLSRGQYTFTIYANGTSGGEAINEYYTTYPFTFTSETIINDTKEFNTTAMMPNLGVMNFTATTVPSIPFYLNVSQIDRTAVYNITYTWNNSAGTWNYTVARGEIIMGPDCLDWGLHASNIVTSNVVCNDPSARSNIWPTAMNFSNNRSVANITAVNVSTGAIHMVHESWSAIINFFGSCATGGTCSVFKNNEAGTTNRASFFNITGDGRRGQINYLASVKSVNASINQSTGRFILLQGMRGSIGQTLTIMLNNTIGPEGNTTMAQNINGTSASIGGTQGTGSTSMNGTLIIATLRNETHWRTESANEDHLVHGWAWANITGLTNVTYSFKAVITYLNGTNTTTPPYTINLGGGLTQDTTGPTPVIVANSNVSARRGDSVNLSTIWFDLSGMHSWVFWSNISGNSSVFSFSGNASAFNLTINVTRGNNVTWIIYANDTATNMNQTVMQSFTVADTAPNQSSITSPTNATLFLTSNFTVTSNTSDADLDLIIQYLYINGTLNQSLNGTNVSFNLTLPDGSYTLKTFAGDEYLNTTQNSTEITIQIDTVGPNVTLQAPPDGQNQVSATFALQVGFADLSNVGWCAVTVGGNIISNQSGLSSPFIVSYNALSYDQFVWSAQCADNNGWTGNSTNQTFKYISSGGGGGGGSGIVEVQPLSAVPLNQSPATIQGFNPDQLLETQTITIIRFTTQQVVRDFTVGQVDVNTCTIDSPYECQVIGPHSIRVTAVLNEDVFYQNKAVTLTVNEKAYTLNFADINFGYVIDHTLQLISQVMNTIASAR